MAPQSRESRRLLVGILLVALPAVAVFAARGLDRPWTPSCPPYRQFGPADAKIVLVEFSDFQCGGCAAAVTLVQQIKSQYGSKVHLYYKHLPWEDMHRWAKDAALAAECAGKQGKFWEMHDALFAKQGEWARADDAPRRFEAYARSAKLDIGALRQCLRDPATAASIQADLQDAKDRWIRATPTFFVNGRRLVGRNQLRIFGLSEIEKRASL